MHGIVDRYRDDQSDHHGYSSRVNPPVLVTSYELSEEASISCGSLRRTSALTETWRARRFENTSETGATGLD